MKKKNLQRFWVVDCLKDTMEEAPVTEETDLYAFGNGHEAQYPIFPTKKDAIAWKKRNGYFGLRNVYEIWVKS